MVHSFYNESYEIQCYTCKVYWYDRRIFSALVALYLPSHLLLRIKVLVVQHKTHTSRPADKRSRRIMSTISNVKCEMQEKLYSDHSNLSVAMTIPLQNTWAGD